MLIWNDGRPVTFLPLKFKDFLMYPDKKKHTDEKFENVLGLIRFCWGSKVIDLYTTPSYRPGLYNTEPIKQSYVHWYFFEIHIATARKDMLQLLPQKIHYQAPPRPPCLTEPPAPALPLLYQPDNCFCGPQLFF